MELTTSTTPTMLRLSNSQQRTVGATVYIPSNYTTKSNSVSSALPISSSSSSSTTATTKLSKTSLKLSSSSSSSSSSSLATTITGRPATISNVGCGTSCTPIAPVTNEYSSSTNLTSASERVHQHNKNKNYNTNNINRTTTTSTSESDSHVLTIKIKQNITDIPEDLLKKCYNNKSVNSDFGVNNNNNCCNINNKRNQVNLVNLNRHNERFFNKSKVSVINFGGLGDCVDGGGGGVGGSGGVLTSGGYESDSLITVEQKKLLHNNNNNHNNSQIINISTTNTTTEMVQKSSGDLEVSSPTYLYYMMTSGQCSPSDTLDSGTCSDLEVTPPPLPKKLSPKAKMNGNTGGQVIIPQKLQANSRHNRNGSYTDSEESESSLSCDSLNCAELNGNSDADLIPPAPPILHEALHQMHTNNGKTTTTSSLSFLPDSLLKDIRDRSKKITVKTTTTAAAATDDFKVNQTMPMLQLRRIKYSPPTTPPIEEEELNFTMTTATPYEQHINLLNKTQTRTNKITNYENDKFYQFHINENVHDVIIDKKPTIIEDDESFAGYKDIHSGTSTIRSSKGTVRGVKNRVRNGIATFLQMQQTNVKNYKEKDSGKVVLYTTSMGIVRDTYAKCSNVKQILRTLLIKFDERDVFMSNDYQQEIKDRMQCDYINIPQLFVDGQHVGDADYVERLNETGELRKMLKPYKCLDPSFTCQMCGGYRLLPCPACKGSKKSVHRNHFTTEFVALKCMNCDEVGLVKCHNC